MCCSVSGGRRVQRGTAQRSACRIAGPDRTESALSWSGLVMRRKAKTHAFRVLAALIAVLLPLQGIGGAMAAIQAPAHFHIRVAAAARGPVPSQLHAPPAIEAKQQPSLAPRSSAGSYAGISGHSHHTSPDRGGSALGHVHDLAPHAHPASPKRHDGPAHLHHESLSAGVPPPSAATHAHDANRGNDHAGAVPRRQSSLVGHHAHGFADSGVVYLDGDPDHPDSSSAGKHAAAAADAALTGWWMPMRGAMGTQSLPHAHWRYQSHPGTPALRPPAAPGVLTA